MKNTILFFIFLAGSITFYYGCKKNETIQSDNIQNAFVKDAISYLQSTLSENDFEKLDFSVGENIPANQEIAIITFGQKDKTKNEQVIVSKLDGKFLGNWLNVTSSSLSSRSFDGSIENEIFYVEGKVAKMVSNKKGVKKVRTFQYDASGKVLFSNSIGQGVSLREVDGDGYTWLPNVTIVAVKNNTPVTYYSMYYYFNQSPSYQYSYTTTPLPSGGGSSYIPPSTVTQAPTFTGPDRPIIDINKELKCYSLNVRATYSITVNVNQPKPGTRGVVNTSAEHQVGHTYFTLEQINPDGTKIIRNIGFYPKDFAKPGSATDQSLYGDDSNMPYSVSIKMSATPAEFIRLVQYINL
ncbi:MAG: hypothetical protein QM768_03700 [Agriterribacter sp.]